MGFWKDLWNDSEPALEIDILRWIPVHDKDDKPSQEYQKLLAENIKFKKIISHILEKGIKEEIEDDREIRLLKRDLKFTGIDKK